MQMAEEGMTVGEACDRLLAMGDKYEDLRKRVEAIVASLPEDASPETKAKVMNVIAQLGAGVRKWSELIDRLEQFAEKQKLSG